MASDNAMYNKIGGSKISASTQNFLNQDSGKYGTAQSAIKQYVSETPPKPLDYSGSKSTGKGTSSSASSATAQVADGGFDALAYMEAVRAQQRAAAEEAYARARNSLNEAYSNASSAYGNIYNSGVDQLGRSYDNSRGKINTEATDAFRQAYVNRMLSEKNLGQRMAAMGMSGGAAESTLAGLINNYGNARSGIQRTLDTNLGDLEMKYQGNLADLYSAYQQNMANIAAQRASQLSNLEMQLANLNANMGGDYYSAMLSNIGNLQKAASAAAANQAAYTAPNAQTVTNTFNPANTQQVNDMGSQATRWWEDQIMKQLANGSNINGAVASLAGYRNQIDQNELAKFISSLAV